MRFFFGFFIFSIFTIGTYADDVKTQCSEKCPLSCLEDPPPANCGYNCPARIDVKGVWDYYASASFLYIQPKEKGLAPALVSSLDFNGLQKSSLIDFKYMFYPAFKAGVGLSSDCDGWNLYAEYTRIYSTTTKKKKLDPVLFGASAGKSYLSPIWGFTGLGPTEGTLLSYDVKARWKLRFNIVDLTLGRSYFVGKKLLFHPFFGFRGGMINQKLSSLSKNVNDSGSFTINSKNHTCSWLIGPRFGLDTSWLLGKGFRFYGNMGASIFFDHFKLYKDDDIVPLSVLSRYLMHAKKKTITSNLDASCGFGWGSYFYNKNWHLDFIMGYDFQIFFEQNYLQYLNLLSNYIEEFTPHNLVLQGLNLKLQIDF